MEVASYHVKITGRVQGVWFRSWTKSQAAQWKLSGWVRNRRDGSVEAVISGAVDHVQEMIKAFEVGPPTASVISVEVTSCDPPDEIGFRQL